MVHTLKIRITGGCPVSIVMLHFLLNRRFVHNTGALIVLVILSTLLKENDLVISALTLNEILCAVGDIITIKRNSEIV